MRTLTKLDGDSSRARRELHDHIQGSGPLARHTVDSHGQRQAGASSFHESAEKHVTGKATYIDDIKTPQDALHVALGLSPVAHGTLTKLEPRRPYFCRPGDQLRGTMPICGGCHLFTGSSPSREAGHTAYRRTTG